MIQLQVLSGKQAGTVSVARRFPFRLGRSATADLRLEDAGVWDQHALLELKLPEGLEIQVHDNAMTTLNGERIQRSWLRPGDLLEIGAVKLRISLSETRQPSLQGRELLTWFFLILSCLGQVALIYWLKP
jgi:pSer/pThr/pTyr-binding forkhead associated (FHA) protein